MTRDARAHLDPRGPLLDLFTFFPADPEVIGGMRDAGFLPWWTDPSIRGGFLRPVSAATHLFDWEVLGGDVVLAHLHSLADDGDGHPTSRRCCRSRGDSRLLLRRRAEPEPLPFNPPCTIEGEGKPLPFLPTDHISMKPGSARLVATPARRA